MSICSLLFQCNLRLGQVARLVRLSVPFTTATPAEFVAAVSALQPFEQDRNDVTPSDRSDDSAHGLAVPIHSGVAGEVILQKK